MTNHTSQRSSLGSTSASSYGSKSTLEIKATTWAGSDPFVDKPTLSSSPLSATCPPDCEGTDEDTFSSYNPAWDLWAHKHASISPPRPITLTRNEKIQAVMAYDLAKENQLKDASASASTTLPIRSVTPTWATNAYNNQTAALTSPSDQRPRPSWPIDPNSRPPAISAHLRRVELDTLLKRDRETDLAGRNAKVSTTLPTSLNGPGATPAWATAAYSLRTNPPQAPYWPIDSNSCPPALSAHLKRVELDSLLKQDWKRNLAGNINDVSAAPLPSPGYAPAADPFWLEKSPSPGPGECKRCTALELYSWAQQRHLAGNSIDVPGPSMFSPSHSRGLDPSWSKPPKIPIWAKDSASFLLSATHPSYIQFSVALESLGWPLVQYWEDNDANLITTEQTAPTHIRNMSQAGQKRSHQTYLGLPTAIFIHAGAGFHSIQNEKFHLTVCSDAASKAMKILNAGGSAVDAVEIAIKHLEDREITNAGFGSNLTIDSTVECDATIVDHLGRSGACGAVPNIKNPISLAKVILNTSSKTLTLRRVPPNFLVGEGAKRFGIDHGITTVTNEELVSRNARDRYQKWRADLDKVTLNGETGGASVLSTSGYNTDASEERRKGRDAGKEEMKLSLGTKARKGLLRDHTSAIMTGLWNEGQPDSPTSETRSPLSGFANTSSLQSGRTTPSAVPLTPSKKARISPKPVRGHKMGASADSANDINTLDGACTPRLDFTELTAEPENADRDMIVDTVGAIAIDQYGNIAAGSSSGGIGMKHMGRTGPAALVGVGTAVVPYNEEDDEFKTVATVTSGTGEHMATTMAAQKCADRLYQSTRRGPGGYDIKDEDPSAILQSFVQTDFMDHPGVKNQASTRAIGVMAVEATASGIYVHWAHNTESFALASMSSNDKQPLTVMSRLPEGKSSINIGARKIQIAESEEDGDGDAGW